MGDEPAKQASGELLLTVKDHEIVTEQKVHRRSFLSATGLVLAGAAGLVSGSRVSAEQQNDPDKRPDDARKKADDPDKRPDDARKKADDARKKSDDARKRPDDARKNTADPDHSR